MKPLGDKPGGFVDFLAGHRHFVDHLRPVAEALGSSVQTPHGTTHVTHASIRPFVSLPQRHGPAVVVASIGDIQKARRFGWQEGIYLCHGIGQTYQNRGRRYNPGGDKPNWVRLFLAPNHPTAEYLASTNEGANVAVVGQPKLDQWLDQATPEDPVVALSFRWRQDFLPEAGTALDHYRESLAALAADLAADGITLVGHGHPRIWDELAPLYEQAGIEPVRDFSTVVRRAQVYVCDNSSTIFEWAALDRPVVLLNCPQYRRDVEHGGRFWEWADVGEQVDHPSGLADAIRRALTDDPHKTARRNIALEVFAHLGEATDKAAEAIKRHLEVTP